MKQPEVLILISVLLIFIISIYKLYYHLVYKRKKIHSKPIVNLSRVLNLTSWIFTFGIVGIAAYLFILPAKADSLSTDTFHWDDYSKPFEIVFDRPINHNSVNHEFSKAIKGRWEFEKADSFDIFKRKLVFYPEESLLPNENINFKSTYTTLLGISTFNINTNIISKKETPELKVNQEVDDKQNVNPEQELKVNIEKAHAPSYVLTFESNPPGVFKENYKYRLEASDTLIPHTSFKNGELYEVNVYSTPISYNLQTNQIIQYGSRSLIKSFKFQTAPAPQVKGILPKGDNVLSSEKIQISFDQSMDRASIEKGMKISPEIEGSFEWNEDSTHVTYNTVKALEKDAKYSITLDSGIKSVYGAKLAQKQAEGTPAVTQEFHTIGSVGVEKTTPSSGAINVRTNGTSISIKFNQEVDKQSAESKISFSPDIDGKFSWDGTTAVFKPNSPLSYAQKYTVTVGSGIKSIEGLDLKSSYTFTFTTESKTVLLKAPIIDQPAQFACNVTAAAIVLQYKGINVSPWDVYNAIPKQSVSKGNGTWGNPNLGYVGNIYGIWGGDKSEGYGVHWDPIRNYIAKYRPAEVKHGWSVSELLTDVENGNPSIVWWQNGYVTPTRISWKTPDGSTINTVNGMHSEVVIGYIGSPDNPSQIILSDPWASRWGGKYHYMSLGDFKALWGYFGNTAVVVR